MFGETGAKLIARLGIGREPDHGFLVFPELGEGHPQTCLMDGVQVDTGATYGKVMMPKTFCGKLACDLLPPSRPCFTRARLHRRMGKFEFFAFRKRGVEPSQIPLPVRREVIEWVLGQPDDAVFKVEARPGFAFTPVKGSFDDTKCSSCGEYVFDRFVRMKGGKPVCIPCSGVTRSPSPSSADRRDPAAGTASSPMKGTARSRPARR